MGKPSVNIPDKVLNFPNPKFVSFIKRMWSSEPVSQAEKDAWTTGGEGTISPHTPLIVVDHVSFVSVDANTDYQTHSILLPDKGDGLNIEFIQGGSGSSSSSDQVLFHNADGFNIAGYLAHPNHTVHFDLDLSFQNELSISANLYYRNTGTITPVYAISGNNIQESGYLELFNNIKIDSDSPTYILKIGLDIDINANTIKLVIKYHSLIAQTNIEFLNRFDIKSY